MNKPYLRSPNARRFLLLQGPVGPFFRRLATMLRAEGAHVEKVNFNGGDALFFPGADHVFRGHAETWPTFLEELLASGRFDEVVLFGDCRPLHAAAREVCAARGVSVAVFEEGYVRPSHVTLERGGVNAFSTLPRDPAFYTRSPRTSPTAGSPVGNAYWFMASWAVLYYAAAWLQRGRFVHYEHHRPLTPREALPWVRSIAQKHRFGLRERGVERKLVERFRGRYFLVPLQVHNDSQVTVHSDFASVEEFIRTVIASFGAHAPSDTVLALKHHPLDRGYHDYTRVICEAAAAAGVDGRVHYLHDQHLPTLLEHARGAVVINSTVGVQALDHRTPLKVCGRALYDMPGLTYSGPLDAFWNDAQSFAVDDGLYDAFRARLVASTQLVGSFYRGSIALHAPVAEAEARSPSPPADLRWLAPERAAE